jgi:Xaa-Pro aminopeptidase
MSGRRGSRKSRVLNSIGALLGFAALSLAFSAAANAQQRRDREPNSVYAARRAKLASEVDGPIILKGFTGREEISEAYVFAQEESFYYLTGHNEEGAGLIILPAAKASGDGWDGPREILYLPAKDAKHEQWNGLRMSPSDPGIEALTGFANVKVIDGMRADVERLAKIFPNLYTQTAYVKEMGGYPHEKEVIDWLASSVPQVKVKDIRANIDALRQIKSPGELAFLQKAIDLSMDAHVEAMKMTRPGLYEYQVAAKMVEVHAMGGSEAEGYAPIVGAGPNSTSLHYDKLSRKIEDGDVIVLDVGAQFAGYSADITRTIPANGKFTARQREIYEIVLGAQNAALEKLKPGNDVCNKGNKSAYKASYDYINSHGKDKEGKSLGKYYIHGLSHHIGLNVHDPGSSCAPLQPGMVVTVEPGIYIPEENLGVRIEDDVLITETGYKFLSERLPRSADEIEKIMAEGAAKRTAKGTTVENASPQNSAADTKAIAEQIAKYAKSVSDADTTLASQVWWNSPEASFIHPLGHEHGFEQIKQNVYQHLMGDTFTERNLSVHDLSIHVFGDSAVAEFYWDFAAKFRKDGAPIATHGRETQVYQRVQGEWRLAHVHYSGMPVSGGQQGF